MLQQLDTNQQEEKGIFSMIPFWLSTNQLVLTAARNLLNYIQEKIEDLGFDQAQTIKTIELWEEQQAESRYILTQISIWKAQNLSAEQLQQVDDLETSTLILDILTTQIIDALRQSQ